MAYLHSHYIILIQAQRLSPCGARIESLYTQSVENTRLRFKFPRNVVKPQPYNVASTSSKLPTTNPNITAEGN